MVLFKDIAKSSSDLITRDFPHATPFDIEIKSVSSPVTLTATGTINTAGHDASIQAAYAQGSVRASGKVSNSAATIDATVAVPKGYALEGLSFQAKHDIKKGKGTTELAAEFFANRCHSRFSVFPSASTFAASTLFNAVPSCNTKVGASLTGNLDGKNLNYSVGTVFAAKGLAFSFRTAPVSLGLPSELIATTQLKKGDIDLAVEASLKSDLKANVAFAVSRQCTPEVGYKFKFSEGKGAFALNQKFSANSTLSLGVEHDGKDGVKIGSKLFFTH